MQNTDYLYIHQQCQHSSSFIAVQVEYCEGTELVKIQNNYKYNLILSVCLLYACIKSCSRWLTSIPVFLTGIQSREENVSICVCGLWWQEQGIDIGLWMLLLWDIHWSVWRFLFKCHWLHFRFMYCLACVGYWARSGACGVSATPYLLKWWVAVQLNSLSAHQMQLLVWALQLCCNWHNPL